LEASTTKARRLNCKDLSIVLPFPFFVFFLRNINPGNRQGTLDDLDREGQALSLSVRASCLPTKWWKWSHFLLFSCLECGRLVGQAGCGQPGAERQKDLGRRKRAEGERNAEKT